MKKYRLIISDKLYISKDLYVLLSISVKNNIRKKFSKSLFDPYLCPLKQFKQECKKINENGYNACRRCKNAYSKIKLYKKTKKWVILERGDKFLINDIIQDIKECFNSVTGKKIKLVDKTVYKKLPIEMQYNILWKTLKEPRKSQQKKTCKQWLKEKYGQIIAPPRSGKTLIGAILASKSKTRTAIIIHQKELLTQFYNTFIEKTDINERAKLYGHTLIKINPKPIEVEKLSVCLYTWQQFLNTYGAKRLKAVRDLFGFILCDEVHKSSAGKYSTIVSRFKARYRCGLTATPNRKDQLNIRQDLIFGPPIIFGGAEQMSCNYNIVDTGWSVPHYKEWDNRTWNYFWNKIAKDEDRNKLIIKYLKEDIKKGYKVIIPVKRVQHAKILVEMLGRKYKSICYTSGTVPKHKRDAIADNIRKGKYDAVIATKQLISLGFDAPPMSCLYCVVPAYDRESFYQEFSRIRTIMKGKKKPLIRIFQDEGRIINPFIKLVKAEFKKQKFKEV